MGIILALIVLSSMFEVFDNVVTQQCGTDGYSIYQKMLKGHTFKTFKAWPMSLDCRIACLSDIRCQSYNYVFLEDICELNNRTKEARPTDFVNNVERYYMERIPRDSLGSIPELPADSCAEIKASEGEKAASVNYWLDAMRSGNSILARCNMKTGIADYCIKHLCLNNASCVNSHVNYTCTCKAGWTGNYCEKDINECKSSSLHDCHSNATCKNTLGSFNCTCKEGFHGDGKISCKDINECKSSSIHDCHSNATCKNTVGSFNCTCKQGFHGDGKISCKDVNECVQNPNSCPAQSSCLNYVGSYNCSCQSGWKNRGPHTCIDVDECSEGSHSCRSNSRCTNAPGSYRCNYLSGWRNQGPHTCADVNECFEGSDRCPSNSRCVNVQGSYQCHCNSGYKPPITTTRCQDINECSTGSYSCPQYGYCVNTIGSYTCRCHRCYYMSGGSCKPDCRLETQYYYSTTYTTYTIYTSCGFLGLSRCSRTKRKTKAALRSRQVWVANRWGASCPCH